MVLNYIQGVCWRSPLKTHNKHRALIRECQPDIKQVQEKELTNLQSHKDSGLALALREGAGNPLMLVSIQ
jgi:hypothetical protein